MCLIKKQHDIQPKEIT